MECGIWRLVYLGGMCLREFRLLWDINLKILSLFHRKKNKFKPLKLKLNDKKNKNFDNEEVIMIFFKSIFLKIIIKNQTISTISPMKLTAANGYNLSPSIFTGIENFYDLFLVNTILSFIKSISTLIKSPFLNFHPFVIEKHYLDKSIAVSLICMMVWFDESECVHKQWIWTFTKLPATEKFHSLDCW